MTWRVLVPLFFVTASCSSNGADSSDVETTTHTCAAIWQCFGDCSDNQTCLDNCTRDVPSEVTTLFWTAEHCTDNYVFDQCAAPGPECDFRAAEHCRKEVLACVHDNTTGDPLIDACPTDDSKKWQAHKECLKRGVTTCQPPELSTVCQELVALGAGP